MTDLRALQGTSSEALRGRRILTLQLLLGRLDNVAAHLPHLPARRQAATDAEAVKWALAELGATDTPGPDAA